MLLNVLWEEIMSWVQTILLGCCMLFLVSVASAGSNKQTEELQSADFQEMVVTGNIKSKKLNEVSGIAPSRMMEDRYWVLNDGGNPERLYLIDASGALYLSVKIKGIKNRDWEDLSSFTMAGISYLMIADVGDNRSKRDDIALHIIAEPDITKLADMRSSVSFKPKATIHLRFEDGPRDCEAVAVDVKRKRILLVSKRTTPPVLYEAPLRLTSTTGSIIVRRIAEINHIPNPTIEDMRMRPIVGVYGASPTAMDINEAGTEMVLLTYKQAYIYHNTVNSWRLAIEQLPKKLSFPLMEQAESVSYSRDGKSVIVLSENVGTPIYWFGR